MREQCGRRARRSHHTHAQRLRRPQPRPGVVIHIEGVARGADVSVEARVTFGGNGQHVAIAAGGGDGDGLDRTARQLRA